MCSTLRVSGELSITQSSGVRHLYDLDKSNADGAEDIFGFCRTHVGCSHASGPILKKALCRTCLVVGRRINKVLFPTIQFNIRTQFYLIHRQEPIRCYHSGPEWTKIFLDFAGSLHSPKLQHYWNSSIRLFSDISRTLVWGVFSPSAEMQSVYSAAPATWATGHSLGKSYQSAYMQLVYTTAATDWAKKTVVVLFNP